MLPGRLLCVRETSPPSHSRWAVRITALPPNPVVILLDPRQGRRAGSAHRRPV